MTYTPHNSPTPVTAHSFPYPCHGPLIFLPLSRPTHFPTQGAHSDAVKANAWHHRSDAMVSLAVLVALVGSMKGFPLLDPLAGTGRGRSMEVLRWRWRWRLGQVYV